MIKVKKSRTHVPTPGGDSMPISGVIGWDATQYSTPADTSEHDAIAIPIKANTLATDGKILRIKAWGSTAANDNGKNIYLYIGSTQIAAQASTANDKDWNVIADIIRTGVGTQKSNGEGKFQGQIGSLITTSHTEDETSAIILKCAVKNNVASEGDIVVEAMTVELLN